MSTPSVLRILYLGRKPKLAEDLRLLFNKHNQAFGEAPKLYPSTVHFQSVSNQKDALQAIRATPPAIVMVEIEKKPESRVRFCDMVRYRLPTAAIVAVVQGKPETSFDFNGAVKLPLVAGQVLSVLEQLPRNCTEYLLQRGALALNMAARTVKTPKGEYTMTPKQCALLQMLMLQHDTIVKRADIMQLIWDTSYLDDTRTLDVHIRWLRECIEPDPSNPIYLKTIRGIGYQLTVN